MKILIIEDEPALNESILFYLKNEGFVCKTALNYNEASQKINDYDYDVIVVDIMLPDGSGLDIVRELKANYLNTGIIILSAKDSLDDKLLRLDLGADDYITKPFHLAELNSRIKSVIRRRKFNGNKEIIEKKHGGIPRFEGGLDPIDVDRFCVAAINPHGIQLLHVEENLVIILPYYSQDQSLRSYQK